MTIQMKNKEVYFEIILPKSNYLNYRLGITKVLSPKQTPLQAWNEACEEAEQWHKQKHPELYQFNNIVLSVEETELVQQIKSSDTLEKLGRLKNKIPDSIKSYYMDKLKTLSNNFSTK